jgi:hypothetical protein
LTKTERRYGLTWSCGECLRLDHRLMPMPGPACKV